METILQYVKAFLVGGTLCLIGQILIDRTRLTPARILTSYVVAGVVLGVPGSCSGAWGCTNRWSISRGQGRACR